MHRPEEDYFAYNNVVKNSRDSMDKMGLSTDVSTQRLLEGSPRKNISDKKIFFMSYNMNHKGLVEV